MMHPQASMLWKDTGFVNAQSGDIGIELEIEGDNLPKEVMGWAAKHEGSLRGKNGRQIHQGENAVDTPLEYVLIKPASMDTLKTRLKVLYNALTKSPVEVRLTPRASTHIHINMTGSSIRTIFGFAIIYTIIEPVLLRLCGPLRNGNLFCLPGYETGELPWIIEKAASAVLNSPRRYWPTRRGKYASLNFDPLCTFGSLEVRCFPNEINPELLHKWAGWLMRIRELASDWGKADDHTYMKLLDRAYNDPSWILTTIFGSGENLFIRCQPNSPAELIAYGVEQAHEIVKAASVALDYKEDAEKPIKKSLFSWSAEDMGSVLDLPSPAELDDADFVDDE